jgi:hypothetical protein
MISKKVLINLSTVTFCLIAVSISLKAVASIGGLGGLRSVDEKQAKVVEQRRTLGSGTRSQCQITFPPNSVTLLVPDENVVHKTANSQPSFYVQTTVARSKTPLNFTLVNPNVSEPVAQSIVTVSKPGTQKIELPSQIQLEQNTIYLWYVGVPCGGDSEYQEILTSSVEFVPASATIQKKLQNNSTEVLNMANVYAENGYWYDALDILLNNTSSNNSASLSQLLSSVGLTF